MGKNEVKKAIWPDNKREAIEGSDEEHTTEAKAKKKTKTGDDKGKASTDAHNIPKREAEEERSRELDKKDSTGGQIPGSSTDTGSEIAKHVEGNGQRENNENKSEGKKAEIRPKTPQSNGPKKPKKKAERIQAAT